MSTAADAVIVERTQAIAARLERVIEAAREVILGKEQVIRLSLACVLARGHLLIEDLPGVGKTTLALVMARVLGLKLRASSSPAICCPPISWVFQSMIGIAENSAFALGRYSRSLFWPTR